jgi:hypothetical protein
LRITAAEFGERIVLGLIFRLSPPEVHVVEAVRTSVRRCFHYSNI